MASTLPILQKYNVFETHTDQTYLGQVQVAYKSLTLVPLFVHTRLTL